MSDPVISPSALARPTVVHRWSYVRECSANRRGFTDGFGGGLAGTLLGCLAVAYFAPGRLEQIWFPLFALPVVLGGFEVWRSQQVRPRRTVGAFLAALLISALLSWWTIGFLLESRHSPRPQPASWKTLSCETRHPGSMPRGATGQFRT